MWKYEKCKQLIEEKGLKRRWIAERCEIVPETLTHLLNGRGKPSARLIEALANTLNCDKEYLLGISNNRHLTKEKVDTG